MADAAETIKNENKLVSDWLLNYHDRLKIWQEKYEQVSVLGATQYDGMPHGTAVNNPTLSKAISMSEVDEYRKWLDVVELAESTLSEKKRMFMKFRRLAVDIQFKQEVGRPAWVDYVSCKYGEWHESRYGIVVQPIKSTMTDWWNEIVEVTVRLAIRKNIL